MIGAGLAEGRRNQEFPDLSGLWARHYIAAQRMTNGNSEGGKVEILLVEDTPADVSSTIGALQKANLFNKIQVLNDAHEAADYVFRSGNYASLPPLKPETLLLLSLNLQGTHSLDLLRRIKGDQRTKDLPVIILTSSQEERGVMQSYTLGASGCIVKPLDLHKFIEVVSDLHLGWLLISPQASGGEK